MKKMVLSLLFFCAINSLSYAQDYGIIKVITPTTECVVYIDDVQVGKGTSTATVKPGMHNITVQLNNGLVIYNKDKTVGQGDILSVFASGENVAAKQENASAEPEESGFDPDNKIKSETFSKVQLSSLFYKEPGLMDLSGSMYGLELYSKATNRENLISTLIQFSLSTGWLNYSGSTWAGAPLKISSIPATMFEPKIVFGYDLIRSEGYTISPFVGLGYRLFADNIGYADPGGYRRQSNYRYFPLGLEYITTPKNNLHFKVILEYDSFLSGTQVSYLGDVDSSVSTMVNEQKSGNGYKISFNSIYKSSKQEFLFEIFCRFWDIADSEPEPLDGTYTGFDGLEPKNTSSDIGVSVGWGF